jgi:ethanolamine utilization protein EutQ (cupin superfamily)
MTTRLVRYIPFDNAAVTEFAPAIGDERYKNSPLTGLGPSFMTWDEDGTTDQWTIGYEEVLYVVSGELTIFASEGGEEYSVTGAEGDVLTVSRGAIARYHGIKGTRAFVCFSPLNWQDLIS